MSRGVPVSPEFVRKWNNAVEAVDSGRLREAASLFRELRGYSSKMWFNMSIVHLLQGDLTTADENLKECLQRDQYLAVAHFHRGVIACRQGRLAEGKGMLAQALKSMPNSDCIDYSQLGLDLRLTREQVQHNQRTIDNYLAANRPNTCTKIAEDELETLPPLLFRPAKSLVDNIEKKQFLKPSQVISAVPDCVLRKNSDGVIKRPQSTSAPTSPSAHRRLGGDKSYPHSTFTPPPCRPPPRLPSSVAGASISSRHRRDNHARPETKRSVDRQDQPSTFSQHLPRSVADDDRANLPSCPPARDSRTAAAAAAELEGGSGRRNAARTTTLEEEEEGRPCGKVRAVHVHGGGDSARSSPALSTSQSSSPPCRLSDRLEAGKTSNDSKPPPPLPLSVAERVREMEVGGTPSSSSSSYTSQGGSGGGARSIARSYDGDRRAEVGWQRSGTGNGVQAASERPKPPRPPPPKFVS